MAHPKVRRAKGSLAEQAAATARYVRRGKDMSPHVALGPAVRDPANPERWYFVVATGEAGTARFDQINADDQLLAERFRAAVLLALSETEPPFVLHDFGDELELIRFCQTLWPSDRVTAIRARMEAERALEAASPDPASTLH